MSSPTTQLPPQFEIFSDDFERSDVSDISTEIPQTWENLSGSAGISSGKLVASVSSTVARFIQERPLPAGGTPDNFRTYRVVAVIDYDDLKIGPVGVCLQILDANNFLEAMADAGANTVRIRLTEGGTITGDTDGSGTAYSTLGWTKWSDPTVIVLEYRYSESKARILVNGEWVGLTRGSSTDYDIPIKSAVQSWPRKGGVKLYSTDSKVRLWKMESSVGEIKQPAITSVFSEPTHGYLLLLADPFVPSTAYGFPSDDSNRKLARVNWVVEIQNPTSGTWSVVATPSTLPPSARVLVYGPVSQSDTYRFSYKFQDDLGQQSSISSRLIASFVGVPSSSMPRVYPKPDTIDVYPFDPMPEIALKEGQGTEVQISELDTGKEQRVNFTDIIQKTFSLVYRVLSKSDMDTLWDFYNTHRGPDQSFIFVNPYEASFKGGASLKSGMVCRFADSGLSRNNFNDLLFSSGIQLVEIL